MLSIVKEVHEEIGELLFDIVSVGPLAKADNLEELAKPFNFGIGSLLNDIEAEQLVAAPQEGAVLDLTDIKVWRKLLFGPLSKVTHYVIDVVLSDEELLQRQGLEIRHLSNTQDIF